MGPSGGFSTVTALEEGYTRFLTTFTQASTGSKNIFFATHASGPWSLRIREVALYEGTEDLGPDPMNGCMLFGLDGFNDQPTIADGFMTLPSGINRSIAQWADVQKLESFTAFTVVRKNAQPPSAGAFQVALSEASTYNSFSLCMAEGLDQGPLAMFGTDNPAVNAGRVIYGQRGGLWDRDPGTTAAIGTRYQSDGETTVWRGDIRAAEATKRGLKSEFRDLSVGSLFGGHTAKYDLAYIALWDRALSDTEMREAYHAIRDQFRREGREAIPEQDWLICEGDSITVGQGAATAYPHEAEYDPPLNGVVTAISAASLLAENVSDPGSPNSLEYRAEMVRRLVPHDRRGRRVILSVAAFGNDFAFAPVTPTAAEFASDLGDYCLAMKADGLIDRLIVSTIPPRTTAGFNTWRNAVNTIITGGTWAVDHAVDAICDQGADATMGPDAAASDTSLYGDGVHPTTAGQVLMAVPFGAAVDSV